MAAFSDKQKKVIRKNMLIDANNLIKELEFNIGSPDNEYVAYISRRLNSSSEELLRE